MYGLKQSPRMWYQKFDTFVRGLGFTRSKADHCVYFKLIGDRVIYLDLYVDYMLLFGNYPRFEDLIFLQIQHERSWCCKIHFGHGNQTRLGKEETLIKPEEVCRDNTVEV